MQILYLCHRLPDAPDKGCKIRAYHQLAGLARRHRVHLLALTDEPRWEARCDDLRRFCAGVEAFPLDRARGYLRCGTALLESGKPITLGFFHSRELSRRCSELAAGGSFDMVIAYSAAMAPFAAPFRDLPRVLDLVDVDSAKWADYARMGPLPLRPVYALEARRLAAYERRLAGEFDRVLVSTGRERDLLLAGAPLAPAVCVPNGVDRARFAPLALEKSRVPSLVFTGQMDYFANVDAVRWFVRECLGELRRRFPDLELVIVGRAPTASVRALAEQPGVTVTGAVEDVRPFLARAWAFVAPMRIARGVQNKILEAMAAELPVVCTEATFGGLAEGHFVPGEHLLAAPPERFVEAVAELLADPERGRRMATAAARRLAETYSWERSAELLEDVVKSAARGRARVRAMPVERDGALVPARRVARASLRAGSVEANL